MTHLLVCYDVNTETREGRRRLRKVAQTCQAFGQRVQLSVFECTVTEVNQERLRQRLLSIIDVNSDSLRIYHLGSQRALSVEAYGLDRYVDFQDPLIA